MLLNRIFTVIKKGFVFIKDKSCKSISMHTFKGLVEEPKQVTSSFCKLKEENSEMSGVYILAFYIEMKKNPILSKLSLARLK